MAEEARTEDDLFALVRKGQVVSVREVLSARPGIVNHQDRLGWTALHYAAMLGNLRVRSLWASAHAMGGLTRAQMAEVLVEFGADVNLQNDDGYTPLRTSQRCA